MDYPLLFRVRQRFERPQVGDIPTAVTGRLAMLQLQKKVKPGERVAITAGSRGIRNIEMITRAIVDHFKSLGAEPFLVPAMGSHGGGTSEGQRKVLASLGITEEAMGCPVIDDMETVEVARTSQGVPLHFSRPAMEADHVFVCNRVKAHTRFDGDIQSGLLKMLLIGLGKAAGASVYHKAFTQYGFHTIVNEAVPMLLETCPILGGLAIVENAYDDTALLEAVRPEQFLDRERDLLATALRWMPHLPFDSADLLIIDEIGKDVSGTGLDSNVVGRKFNDHAAVEGESPRVKLIALRDLTRATGGNANGMGMAEFCRSSLLAKADHAITRFNAITADHASAAMSPLDYPTDRTMIDAALRCLADPPADELRLMWIANTLHLEEVECSAAYFHEATERDDLEVLTGVRPMPFDAQGDLPERMLNWTEPKS